MTSLNALQVAALAAILCSLTACSDALPDEPTPEAAKQFLQLRGYQFDEKSFFTAAANRDLMAINGFIAAGMKPDVKDENGDTALTLAADRGDADDDGRVLRRPGAVPADGAAIGAPALETPWFFHALSAISTALTTTFFTCSADGP